MEDSYRTIAAPTKAEFVEQRSRFISFAHPVSTEEGALELVAQYRKEYNDSRHVCWAYRLGENYDQERANDDGEPSGTAGRPILGQIHSFNLTNVIVLVVRYFGGIKLGTGGLVSAYQKGAEEALKSATIQQVMIGRKIRFTFDYSATNEVNHVINDLEAEKSDELYTDVCVMTLEVPRSQYLLLKERLFKVETLEVIEEE